MRSFTLCAAGCLFSLISVSDGFGQARKWAAFRWKAPDAKALPAGVRQESFKSASMGVEVGFCIYLPAQYEAQPERRFPVVYHLHGGRPGGELRSVKLAKFVGDAVAAKQIEPVIYVFPNGGPVSWYNYPEKENAMGEDVFVKELIPHVDKTFRTVGKREGRAIEGFSQGGRGTTRIMFKYPQLFCSAAPGGSGYGPEKRIQEDGGKESAWVKFARGYNTWDLAKVYAENKDVPRLKILLWVGTKGFNYESNLEFNKYLDGLGVPNKMLVAKGATHSAKMIYEKRGLELMKFHERNFSAQ